MCVAAGVPSLDNANEIIEKSRAAGLRHIAFKPGSEVCRGKHFSVSGASIRQRCANTNNIQNNEKNASSFWSSFTSIHFIESIRYGYMCI
jgi:hypothetical protein